MQWLIDIIVETVLASISGIIVMWSGTFAEIPEGWALCDGDNGTPDLRVKFIWGTGVEGLIGSTGGDTTHVHGFTSNTHQHTIPFEHHTDQIEEGVDMISTSQGPAETTFEVVTGTTDLTPHIPPYYILAFIMKL